MFRVAVLAAIGLAAVWVAGARGEVNSVEAFRAHAEFMTRGVWVSTDRDEKAVVDRHVPSKSKKFVQVQSIVGDEYVVGVYGVDPKSGKLTFWSFHEDGAVGVWTCTGYQNGRWTWEGRTVGPNGEESGTAVSQRVNDNELTLVIEADARVEQVWKRR